MLRWLVLALVVSVPLRAQSISDFPSVPSVSRVTIVGYILLFDLSKIQPNEDFKRWWREVEECTGTRSDFDDIIWYQANQIVNPAREEAYWGVYFHNPPEIVVLRNVSPERMENTIKHEILHRLIEGQGHDEKLFNTCLPLGLGHD